MEEELDRQDEGLSSSSLEEMFTKIAQKATAKEVQKMKSILRKNSSGGAADQDPEPSNSGTRPSGGQNRQSRGRSNQPSGRSSNFDVLFKSQLAGRLMPKCQNME